MLGMSRDQKIVGQWAIRAREPIQTENTIFFPLTFNNTLPIGPASWSPYELSWHGTGA
jgi:hypothetical protein